MAATDPRADPSVTEVTPFSCDVSYVEDRTVVFVRGEVDLATAPIVLQRLRSAVALPPGGLAVDLGRVTFMDSSGVAALLEMRREAAAQGVPFTVATVADQTRMVLEITGLTALFGLEP